MIFMYNVNLSLYPYVNAENAACGCAFGIIDNFGILIISIHHPATKDGM